VTTEGLGPETPDPSVCLALEEERRHTVLSLDNDVCLAWLEGALQRLRPEGQKKVVGYLEVVLEEVLFEMKVAPRS
jgi:hypothetical protein